MTGFLPLFPLELVVFPGEKLNLHIFEPRYKQLVKDCVEEQKNFGIPVFMKKQVMEYGAEMKVLNIEKTYENGEMDIRTEGVRTIKILEFIKELPDKLYSGGVIAEESVRFDSTEKSRQKTLDNFNEMYAAMNIPQKFVADQGELTSSRIAHLVGLTLEQEYDLLTVSSEDRRLQLLRKHIRKVLPVVKRTEALRQKIQANGHFRWEIPPQY